MTMLTIWLMMMIMAQTHLLGRDNFAKTIPAMLACQSAQLDVKQLQFIIISTEGALSIAPPIDFQLYAI